MRQLILLCILAVLGVCSLAVQPSMGNQIPAPEPLGVADPTPPATAPPSEGPSRLKVYQVTLDGDLGLLLLVVAIAGAFGGIAEWCARVLIFNGAYALEEERLTRPLILGGLLLQAVVGMCGAFAVIFVFACTRWFEQDGGHAHALWLITLSVVAGYGSRRFMPIVSQKLERQMEDLERKLEHGQRVESKKNADRDWVREMAEKALAVFGASANPTATEIGERIKDMKKVLERFPLERVAAIVAGRLLRKVSRLNEAIQLQSEFIEKKRSAKQLDRDFADVLYNRACYRCILWAANPTESLLRAGLDDLKESVNTLPSNAQSAAEDDDFSAWRSNKEFQSLVGRPFPSQPPASAPPQQSDSTPPDQPDPGAQPPPPTQGGGNPSEPDATPA